MEDSDQGQDRRADDSEDVELSEGPSSEPQATTRQRVGRLLDHLTARGGDESSRQRRERRATASAALAQVAIEQPDALVDHVATLVEELRRTNSEGESPGTTTSVRVRDHLVRCVSRVVLEDSGAIGSECVEAFAAVLTADLADETVRLASKALFVGASDRPEAFSPAVDALRDLVSYPDSTVKAWSAGALGQLASSPAEVAATADALRELLDHDDTTVQHNAVEALGRLVRERPDAVAPAADGVRDLLGHADVAIQHNAAGILAHLAAHRPAAVAPAIDDLQRLCDHDEEAVRERATLALARLVDAFEGTAEET